MSRSCQRRRLHSSSRRHAPARVIRGGPPNAPTGEPIRTAPQPAARRLGGDISAAASRSCWPAPTPRPKSPSRQAGNDAPAMDQPRARAPTRRTESPSPPRRPWRSVMAPIGEATRNRHPPRMPVARPANAGDPWSCRTMIAPKAGTIWCPPPTQACVTASRRMWRVIAGGTGGRRAVAVAPVWTRLLAWRCLPALLRCQSARRLRSGAVRQDPSNPRCPPPPAQRCAGAATHVARWASRALPPDRRAGGSGGIPADTPPRT
jgi:hypothetical protein